MLKKHVPSEFALVSKLFSKLFPKTFSKLFGKIGFGKKFGKKWFSPIYCQCKTGLGTKI
jgi:hypothetical protein